MEPSRQTRSSYGPPYPLGRWSSDNPNLMPVPIISIIATAVGADLTVHDCVANHIITYYMLRLHKRLNVQNGHDPLFLFPLLFSLFFIFHHDWPSIQVTEKQRHLLIVLFSLLLISNLPIIIGSLCRSHHVL